MSKSRDNPTVLVGINQRFVAVKGKKARGGGRSYALSSIIVKIGQDVGDMQVEHAGKALDRIRIDV